MPRFALSALGKLVRDKRGTARLRDTAVAIGVSAATLMRIESGRIPDVETFGKVCRWLQMDPSEFLGSGAVQTGASAVNPPVQISSHFRIDKLPLPDTASALARMLLYVAEREALGAFKDGDA